MSELDKAIQALIQTARASAMPIIGTVHGGNDDWIEVDVHSRPDSVGIEPYIQRVRVPFTGHINYIHGDRVTLTPVPGGWIIGGVLYQETDGTKYPRLRADTLYSPATDTSVTVGDLASIDKVRVSSNDSTADYLFNQISAGVGITKTELNNGADENVNIALTVPVSAINGGTAQTVWAQGDTLYASAANTLAKLAKGTSGQFLKIGATIPAWASIVVADIADIASTYIAKALITAKGDLIGATASATPAAITVGNNYQVLNADSSQSTGLAYVYGVLRQYTKTDSTTVGNNLGGTLNGNGEGTRTLPASRLAAGTTIRLTASGYYSTDAVAPTIQFLIGLGTPPTTVLDGTAVTLTGGVTNQAWRLEAEITCRTIGASGTVIGQGQVTLNTSTTAALVIPLLNTATTTIDTTVTHPVNFSAAWGTADPDNTITCTNLVVEVIG